MIKNRDKALGRAFGAAIGIGAAAAAGIFVSHAIAQTSTGPFTEAQGPGRAVRI